MDKPDLKEVLAELHSACAMILERHGFGNSEQEIIIKPYPDYLTQKEVIKQYNSCARYTQDYFIHIDSVLFRFDVSFLMEKFHRA